MKKKFFQINNEKNGPIAGPEMKSCPRQCTVCPDASEPERPNRSVVKNDFFKKFEFSINPCLQIGKFQKFLTGFP